MEEEEEDRVTEPRFTIGAQDISTLNTTNHHGFLRYEGSLEKFVKRTVIFKPFFREAVKCKQRFVVLCEGCMYLYKDEYATSPLKAFSLADFTRIQRFQDNDRRTRMKFQLVPLNESSPQKFLTFCSSTDEERKVWFQKIRKEMDEAVHGSSHLQRIKTLLLLQMMNQRDSSFRRPILILQMMNQKGLFIPPPELEPPPMGLNGPLPLPLPLEPPLPAEPPLPPDIVCITTGK
ncbi:unnamed protein product [Mytilus edulis]|uniref:PH domain-containing protein n=1 Tax=Mytilus edulis TaxID=6550 RepID=A0A8S3QRT7_MYTED|nr:unnamed protein product [Mytilus edulis]